MILDKIDKRKVSIAIIIFVCICLVSGGTYALWEFAFDDITNVVFTTSVDYSCGADGGGPITSSEVVVMPADCTSEKNAIVREVQIYTQFKNDSISSVATSLWLNINELGSELSNSEHFRYSLTTSRNSCSEDVVSSGNFNGLSNGDKVNLLNNKKFSTGTPNGTYYLYIWLDKEETNPNTANQGFNFSLGGECSDSSMIPENPVLDKGMIPVTIADNGKVTTVSASDPNWYDYSKQEWANMVLVSDTNRSNYVNNLSKNVEVAQSDILAYYVWVPRYKYKVWTLGTGSSPQTIDIVFESKDSPMVSGTTVGSYRSHPAFWWDSNSNGEVESGEMLAGIWVGKFEPSGSNSKPTILPKKIANLTGSVKTQFETSLKFAGGSLTDNLVTFSGNNTYGLTDYSDSHMMKNSEWGAVAYLSHSIYGTNKEVRLNNSFEAYMYTTGCGATSNSANSSYDGSCDMPYGSGISEYPQSTTGNISGVFDMSGGYPEYVMGRYGATLDLTTDSSDFTILPLKKYYDAYTMSTISGCTLRMCGGHALNETAKWYSDTAGMDTDYPWFLRGGDAVSSSSAGIFAFSTSGGYAMDYSWRSVIVSVNPSLDITPPTCTLSVTDSGIKFDTYSDDVVSMGLSTSSTATYNSTTSLSLSTGTKYGYVKDIAGNVGSCSVDIALKSRSSAEAKYLYCNDNNYVNPVKACTDIGYTLAQNNCIQHTVNEVFRYKCTYDMVNINCRMFMPYEINTITMTRYEWEQTYSYISGEDYCRFNVDPDARTESIEPTGYAWFDGGYESLDSACVSSPGTMGTCDASKDGTIFEECSTYNYYDGQIFCEKVTYSCNTGYTQVGDSYCYKYN